MASGIGLDVIKKYVEKECLFSFNWYNPITQTQYLKFYKTIWIDHLRKYKSIYIPFKYKGVYQKIKCAELRI